MKVITIEEATFYLLIEEVVARVLQQHQQEPDPFVPEHVAMDMLSIRSKTTMWKLRSEGQISYTQPRHKIILYERASIIEYLEKHKKSSF